MFTFMRGRVAGVALTGAIVALALVAANIHFGLGGLLFTMNGLGYVGLTALFVIGATVSHPLVRSFSWAPRVMLAGYAGMTIVGYLVMGPYFTLGWITKGIEVTLIALIAVDVMRVYGSPAGLVRAALASIPARRTGAAA
jgi:hypothetical protein